MFTVSRVFDYLVKFAGFFQRVVTIRNSKGTPARVKNLWSSSYVTGRGCGYEFVGKREKKEVIFSIKQEWFVNKSSSNESIFTQKKIWEFHPRLFYY